MLATCQASLVCIGKLSSQSLQLQGDFGSFRYFLAGIVPEGWSRGALGSSALRRTRWKTLCVCGNGSYGINMEIMVQF